MKPTTSEIDKIALEKVNRSNIYTHDNEGDSLRV